MSKAPVKTGKKKTFKKKEKKMVHSGVVHVQASFNNTIVTIADQQGNVISWSSAGSLGFQGSRKGTPFAAQQAAAKAAAVARDHGLRSVEVRVNGPGSGREMRHPRAVFGRLRCNQYQGHYSDSPQRLPAAQAPARVGEIGF